MVATGFYLAMGWGESLCYFELARRINHRALLPILYGGLFYSVGAVLNLLRWPTLWPGVFGPHELFHLFVMAGSLCHFWFMLTVVAHHRPGRLPPALPAEGEHSPAPRYKHGELTSGDAIAVGRLQVPPERPRVAAAGQGVA